MTLPRCQSESAALPIYLPSCNRFCSSCGVRSNVDIHFAFPDGALNYDCRRCDQRCCKTGRLSVFARERVRLLGVSPALELVAPPSAPGDGSFATPPSGCWFLTGDLCTLAASHGGALRPIACTLFPFNVFAKYGSTLVVAPNSLCPLQVRPHHGVTHADVIESLAQLGAAGPSPTSVRVGDPPDALALERLLRDAVGSVISGPTPLPLLALAEFATETFVGGGIEALALLDLRTAELAVGPLQERLNYYAAILGIDPPDAAAWATVTAIFAAWMPSLRLLALAATPLGRLARAQSALALYLAHWCALRPGRAPLPQTLAQLANTMGPLCDLLSRWDEPWAGERVSWLALEPGEPLCTVESHLSVEPVARQRQLWALAQPGLRSEASP